MSLWSRPVWGLLISLAASCATTAENHARDRLGGVESRLAPRALEQGEKPALDGTLAGYLAYAVAHHPRLRVAVAVWRSRVASVAAARRMPPPTFGYGFFIRSVETRVGPQRHRFKLAQRLPWPREIAAARAAASAAATAAEYGFDAELLTIRERVAGAYWRLWLVRERREIEKRRRELLVELAAAVRVRLEVGKASLADLSRVDLAVSRLDDALATLAADEVGASAALIAASGAEPGTATALVESPPAPALPAASELELHEAASRHPRITGHDAMARAGAERARKADAQLLPNLSVGVDYIEIGPAANPGPDSGKDAIVAAITVSLPVWRGAYRADQARERAAAAASRARSRVARDDAAAELTATLASVSDSHRRIELYHSTLIAQAELVYEATLGDFHTGAAALADVIDAERQLLRLELDLARARADHASAWARLEAIVGRKVDGKEMK